MKGFTPDRVFLFDLPIETGLSRAAARGRLDRFEQSGLDFFERVRKGFLSRANQAPERYTILDASQTLFGVQSDILSVFPGLLEQIRNPQHSDIYSPLLPCAYIRKTY